MLPLKKSKGLKKELKLLDVYSVATGTTLSAGFFLLPGLAAVQAGPALIAAYLIAAVPLIPGMFSIIELSTAMPRAGGIYYFLDRTLGPVLGTIGGIGTWFALILKVSFALIGMSAYLEIFFPNLPIIPISIGIAVLLGAINLFGTKKSGNFQTVLVFSLLILLAIFIAGGIPEINREHFKGFFDVEFNSILSTAGLVFVSYVGLTKVASLSEEVQNPETEYTTWSNSIDNYNFNNLCIRNYNNGRSSPDGRIERKFDTCRFNGEYYIWEDRHYPSFYSSFVCFYFCL